MVICYIRYVTMATPPGGCDTVYLSVTNLEGLC